MSLKKQRLQSASTPPMYFDITPRSTSQLGQPLSKYHHACLLLRLTHSLVPHCRILSCRIGSPWIVDTGLEHNYPLPSTSPV